MAESGWNCNIRLIVVFTLPQRTLCFALCNTVQKWMRDSVFILSDQTHVENTDSPPITVGNSTFSVWGDKHAAILPPTKLDGFSSKTGEGCACRKVSEPLHPLPPPPEKSESGIFDTVIARMSHLAMQYLFLERKWR